MRHRIQMTRRWSLINRLSIASRPKSKNMKAKAIALIIAVVVSTGADGLGREEGILRRDPTDIFKSG